MPSKLIVTNRKRLRSKYGSAGLDRIGEKLTALVVADKKRGIDTGWVSMDIQSDVGPRSAPKISDPEDPGQTKRCIDALCAGAAPDYLVILGAPDVVCHQSLTNPIVGDEDVDVPSDLPYACDAGFSDEISDFAGPTRVVGRLPDAAGASDPAALLSALDTAIEYQRRSTAAYRSYCAISAEAWKESTRKSIRAIFGRRSVQFIVPPAGRPWSKVELKARMHLVNCHGLDFDTAFYGDDGNGSEPLAIDQADYQGRLRDGVVVAAECCYGAMLYDGSLFSIPRGICNTVLANGCYAFLGSTNVAYGPADSNDYADLVCRYFLQNMRNGASAGRALLEARQRYILSRAPLDPLDLKTLAQFCLLGDPSVHPVRMSLKSSKAPANLGGTTARRKALGRRGKRIGGSVAHVNSRSDDRISAKMQASLDKRVRSKRYRTSGAVLTFTVHAARQPALAGSNSALKKAEGTGCFHVVNAYDTSRPAPDKQIRAGMARKARGPDVLLVAFEEDNAIRSVKKVYRR